MNIMDMLFAVLSCALGLYGIASWKGDGPLLGFGIAFWGMWWGILGMWSGILRIISS